MKFLSFILLFSFSAYSEMFFHHCKHPEAHIAECKIMQLDVSSTWYACQVTHEDGSIEVGQLRIYNDFVEFIVFGTKDSDEVYVRSGSLIFEDFKKDFTEKNVLYTVTNVSMIGRFILDLQTNFLKDFNITLEKHKIVFTPLDKSGNLFKEKYLQKLSFGIVLYN
jgi:hypothetical protein